MSLSLEIRKLKRTGFFPAFLAGGLLAASFPILNTAVRPENFIHQGLPPLDILMDANWQMIAMLNLFFLVIGSCILYHTEFADHAIQKMESLPLSPGKLFANKGVILIGSLLFVLVIEALSIAFCAYRWFSVGSGFPADLLKSFGYELVLLIPASICMLFVSSLCQNLWISLGIGVICIFVSTMLPADRLALSLFPFALPFQTLTGAESSSWAFAFLVASGVETILAGMAEAIVLKVRRNRE